ncbi:MAG: DUF615 domain-containing protein [Deltaproteobacteria bacterium]|nr:DUF615 domain-containing protein [Deltaproteobacteria bacterium]MBW2634505.1 DUF615 domain-containing protein [Deltaproteobacteria bacterium]
MQPPVSNVSRTQKKKEALALQKLGQQLVALSPEQFAKITLPDELREAVTEVRAMTSHGARRRQIKYIGAIVREIDSQPIQEALDNIRHGDYQMAAAFKQIEQWRDDLRGGNTARIEEILNTCPTAQRQRLAQLTRNAQAEYRKHSGVKASRTLFRYLKQIFAEKPE